MEAGLLIRLIGAIIEFIVAAVAYKISTEQEELLGWLKVFAVGVALHGISLITGAFAPKVSTATLITPPLRALSLVLIFYSLLEGVGYKNKKLLAYIIAVAAYFAIGVDLVHALKIHRDTPAHFLSFDLPHILMVIITPLIVAAALYKTYKESDDRSAAIFSAGMVVYALGMVIALISLHFGASFVHALLIKDALWTIAFIVILAAFVTA